MASVDWPWSLVDIQWEDYETGPDPDVDRTPFEDGAVRQATTVSRPLESRQFNVIVKHSNKAAFDTWTRTNSNKWFNFRDVTDKAVRDCRLRGGRGSFKLRAAPDTRRYQGDRYWTGTVEIEGFW